MNLIACLKDGRLVECEETLSVELLDNVRPETIVNYAQATGWIRNTRIREDGDIVVFNHPDKDNFTQLLIPALGFDDYAMSVAAVVIRLACKEHKTANDVLQALQVVREEH